MDLKEAGLISGDIAAHWYYRAKLAALCRLIPPTGPTSVLDVGAGLGFFAASLLEATAAYSAVCVDPGYQADRNEQRAGKPLLFRRSVRRSDADLVLMMDVIEHVEDDVGLVREYVAKVDPGTRFIVTVPAFAWLWSGHDEFLGHVRRYTLTGIETVLRRAGLDIERGCYFYTLLLPAAALSRRIGRWRLVPARSQMREMGPSLDALLWSVCRAELRLFRTNRLFGLTAFVRAIKASTEPGSM